ncbi:MAG: efflux transporter periplasmic adaptor subunit, partial [Rhizobiaceae bacterium]
MSVWKQSALALVILVAAAVGWAWFFPGASDVLSRWGIDWAAAAVKPSEPADAGKPDAPGGRGQGGGPPGVITAAVTSATINDTL